MLLRTSTLWTRKGSSTSLPASRKKCAACFKPPPVSRRIFFARNFDVHAEVAVSAKVVGDHVGEVVGVDDDVVDSGGTEAMKRDFEEGLTGNFDKGLGTVAGERLQPGAEAGGKNHRLHEATFSGKFFSSSTC